jgi:hypothetical protein
MSTIPSIVSQSKAAGSPLTRTELARFLPTKRAIDVFNALTVDVPTVIDQSNLLAQEVDSFSFNFDALNADVLALQAEDVFLQSQIDGIEVSTPGAITGLMDGLVVDNAPIFQAALGPAELGGTIIAADGVVSSVPISATGLLVKSTITVDPQISIYWNARGGTVLVPDPRLPGIIPGTPGTATRVGGGGPGSVIRPARRAPGLNKQAYQQSIGGFCIDATGVLASKNFTCNSSGVFTSSGHGRLNGDVIFFDSDSIATPLPTPLVNGNDSAIANSYQVNSATTNTFKVNAYNPATKAWDIPVTTAAGNGVWSTNVCGIRVPNQKPTENLNDGDQDYDDNKQYTAGIVHDIDISGMSGHGFICEDNNGRLHIDSARAMNCRLNGWHILSQDKVLSGHWAAGSNGKFGLYADTGTGVYAVTGNIWGNPGKRSKDCGAIWFDDVMYWSLVANQPNDWMRFDGKGHFNAAGAIVGNMIHPHGENYSSDGVGINVYNDGDVRLQAHISVRGYQGVQFAGNAFCRTEGVKSRFNTPGNFNGALDGANGTAAQYLYHFDTLNGNPAMAQIIEGYCTAMDVKPWQGPFSAITTDATNGVNWTGHPLIVGNRVFFHGPCGGLTADTVEYWVVSTTTNAFQVSATAGGSAIALTSTSGGTCYQRDSSPYYVAGSSRIAGLYVDSYRGIAKLWSINGFQPKFMIGTSTKNQPWEGDPNLYCEIGTIDKVGGNYQRNALYGSWELGQVISYRDTAYDRNALSGPTFSVNVNAGCAYRRLPLSGGTFTSGTITLPGGMKASCPLRIVITGQQVTSLLWAFGSGAGWISNGITAPAWVPAGGLTIDLWFEPDQNKWAVIAFSTDGGLVRRIDNVATPTGVVGEQIQSKVNSGSAISLTNATVSNVTSITLTPGDWTVQGGVVFTNTATTTNPTLTKAGISTTSANIGASDASMYANRLWPGTAITSSGTDFDTMALGPTRIAVAAGTTQTVYLCARSNFAAGTMTAYGFIRAIATT